MKFLLLRNEDSIGDIVEKAYKGLTTASREQAEVELLKANPELKTFRSVRKGFVVRIPELKDKGKINDRSVVGPSENLALEISNSLELFETSLDKNYSFFDQWAKETSQKLKAADKELKNHPKGQATSKVLNKYITDSKKRHEANKKLAFEALAKLQKSTATYNS